MIYDMVSPVPKSDMGGKPDVTAAGQELASCEPRKKPEKSNKTSCNFCDIFDFQQRTI